MTCEWSQAGDEEVDEARYIVVIDWRSWRSLFQFQPAATLRLQHLQLSVRLQHLQLSVRFNINNCQSDFNIDDSSPTTSTTTVSSTKRLRYLRSPRSLGRVRDVELQDHKQDHDQQAIVL